MSGVPPPPPPTLTGPVGSSFPPPPMNFPPPPFLPPLPPGWTEHRAAGGVLYWHNAATGASTYTRPAPVVPPPGFVSLPPPAPEKKKKKEKPKDKTPIPGTTWIRVKTTEGNVFYMDKESKKSEWTIPEAIKTEVESLEAAERAAQAEQEEAERVALAQQKAEEEASARVEVERLRAELSAASAASSKKRRSVSPQAGDQASKKARHEDEEEAPSKDEEPEDELPEQAGPDGEDDEEAWQRAVAAEMAIEYVDPKERPRLEKEQKEREKQEEQERVAKEEEEAKRKLFNLAPAGYALPPGGKVEMTVEEGRALFKSLLFEKNISPVAPWEMSLPLFINDPRYILLSSIKDRREVFDEYCREKSRELRLAKAAAAASKAPVDPEREYRDLLRIEVTSTRTRWEDFKRTWKKDRRFFGWGRDDREREKAFKTHLKDLGERKRADAKRAETDFLQLLSESTKIKPDSVWKEVKRNFERDPRYDAVGSSSLREELFLTQLRRLASATSSSANAEADAAPSAEDGAAHKTREKKERAEAALRERQGQVQAQQGRVQSEMARSRGLVGREEAEREFGTLLVDQVREHDASWSDYLPRLEKDPRFNSPSLNPSDKHRLFSAHLSRLQQKRLAALHDAFSQHAPALQTSFEEIHSSIVGLPAVVHIRLPLPELEDEFARWQRSRNERARVEFAEMLGENSFVKFWGGLQKKRTETEEERRKRKGGGVGGNESSDSEEDEGEEGGGKADLAGMAKQIDLEQIERVLSQDKRYIVWDHMPDEREQWLRDYLATLEAPKASVHVS